MARAGSTVAVLPLLLGFAGCVDLTPVTLGVSEAGVTSDGGVPNECELCLLGDEGQAGCGQQISACYDDPKCPNVMRCLFDNDCTRFSNSEEVNRCSLPCVLNAGVTSPSDPGVVHAIALSNCSAAACPGRCYYAP